MAVRANPESLRCLGCLGCFAWRRLRFTTSSLTAGALAFGLATSPAFADEAVAGSAGSDKNEGILAGVEEPPPKQSGLPYYEELLKASPEDPHSHQLLAAAYARAGREEDARRSARRAIDLEPTNAEFHQTLGLIEEGADKLPAAEAAFRKATTLDGNVEFRLDLARVLWRLDRRAESDAVYAALATEYPENREVWLGAADSYRGLGRNDEAGTAYDQALRLSTEPQEKANILMEKARMVAERGQTSTALGLLGEARTVAPDDPEIHYNLGVLYYRAAQYDAAVKAFDDAIAKKADHDNALNNKGVTLEKQGKLEDAKLAFEKAAAVDPSNAFAHYNLGLVLFKLRKFKEAEVAFERCLKVDEGMSDARFFLGEIYFQLGDTKKALRLYKDALHSNPDDADTHRRIGDLHLQAGEIDLAVGEYWGAVDADADNADLRAQLMRVLLVRNKEGDVRRAVKLGEDGLEKDAKSLAVRKTLADAEVASGRSPKARLILEEGVRLTPKEANAYVSLGRFLLDQGAVVDAEASYGQAIKLEPNNAAAIAGLGDAALSQGQYDRAEKAFRRALTVDPTMAGTRAELGYILYKANKNAEALKELQRAATDNERLGRAWFYLAFAQAKAGQNDKIEVSLKKAVAVQPDLAEAWLHLGKRYAERGEKKLAQEAFLTAEKARGGTYEEARLELERLQ